MIAGCSETQDSEDAKTRAEAEIKNWPHIPAPKQDQLHAIFRFNPDSGIEDCRELILPLTGKELNAEANNRITQLQRLVEGANGKARLDLLLSRSGQHRLETQQWQVANGWYHGRELKQVNGKPSAEQRYEQGYAVGTEQHWFPNGKLALKGHWLEGERHGEWQLWYINGQQAAQWGLQQGRLHGPMTVWGPNGSELAHARYSNGQAQTGMALAEPQIIIDRVFLDAARLPLPDEGYSLTLWLNAVPVKTQQIHIEYSQEERQIRESLRNAAQIDYSHARHLARDCQAGVTR